MRKTPPCVRLPQGIPRFATRQAELWGGAGHPKKPGAGGPISNLMRFGERRSWPIGWLQLGVHWGERLRSEQQPQSTHLAHGSSRILRAEWLQQGTPKIAAWEAIVGVVRNAFLLLDALFCQLYLGQVAGNC